MKKSKLLFAFTVAACVTMTLLPITAGAAETETETATVETQAAEPIVIREGYTVTADPNVAAGYVVTFGYRNDEAETVTFMSNMMFSDEEKTDFAAVADVEPEDWQPGMWRLGSAMLSREMTKDEETGLWTISIPLPSGMYTYLFQIDGGETIPDPVNPQQWRYESDQPYSQAFVAYDAEYHEDNFDVLMPRTDEKTGTVEYIEYSTENADYPTRYAGVYLPYGFDANREIPYKVLVLIHGTGGTDSEWMCGGDVPNIMDNLIADGYVEPTIVVTMNMYANDVPSDERMSYLDADTVNIPALLDSLLPYLEENYNVSSYSCDRAIAGLSQGCSFTSYLYYSNPLTFGYFGFLSAGLTTSSGGMGFQAANKVLDDYVLSQKADYRYAQLMIGIGYL